MKKKNGLLILAIITVIGLTSCAGLKDPWGNKQTYWERKQLNEMGCPGHSGFVGYGGK